jgi:hypothetical protein
MLEQLTLGDLADIEDVSGVSLTGVDITNLPMKAVLAVIWVLKRHEEPSFTYEKARALSIDAITAITAGLTANPTKAPPGIPAAAD